MILPPDPLHVLGPIQAPGAEGADVIDLPAWAGAANLAGGGAGVQCPERSDFCLRAGGSGAGKQRDNYASYRFINSASWSKHSAKVTSALSLRLGMKVSPLGVTSSTWRSIGTLTSIPPLTRLKAM